MNKYTPGPWHMPHPDSPFLTRARAGGNMIPIASEFSRIASVWHAHEANARLIAAAPDLLAALENAIPWLVMLGDHIGNGVAGDPNGRCGAILLARAAIAKARGES